MSAMFPPALVVAVCAARWSMPAATLATLHGLTRHQVWKIWERHRGLIRPRPLNGEDDHPVPSIPQRPSGLAEKFGVTAVERRVGNTVVSLARVRFLDGETRP